MTATSTDPWTSRRLLAWMTEHFTARDVDAPRVVAEMLLADVFACDRMRLYMDVARVAEPGELERLRGLVRRAGEHEPVQYLVGRASFHGAEFLVDASTLIPQPCTEDLIAAVTDWAREDADADVVADVDTDTVVNADEDADTGVVPDPVADVEPWSRPVASWAQIPRRIADVGTGSGCIAVALARRLPGATIVATDVVPEALDLARRNVERFGVEDRVELRRGDLLAPLDDDGGPYDAIVSNPPYVTDAEWEGGQVQRAVMEHVPPSATRGGTDGLACVEPIIRGAAARLRPGGLLAIEIGPALRDRVLEIARSMPEYERADVARDYEGHWRVFTARRTRN